MTSHHLGKLCTLQNLGELGEQWRTIENSLGANVPKCAKVCFVGIPKLVTLTTLF